MQRSSLTQETGAPDNFGGHKIVLPGKYSSGQALILRGVMEHHQDTARCPKCFYITYSTRDIRWSLKLELVHIVTLNITLKAFDLPY